MAIAGSHQNTLAQLQSGAISMIKGTAEGWVAKAGVEAALLAHHGVTGPLGLMEGAAGWADTVAGTVDFDALCAPIDGRYRLLETSIKPYPAVATAIAPIRAAIELHRAGLPPLDQIERMVVRLPAFALGTPSAHAGRRYPPHIESAQHSFYYCAAIALLDGACGEAQFTAAKLSVGAAAGPAGQGRSAGRRRIHRAMAAERRRRGRTASARRHTRSHRCPYPPGSPAFCTDRR